MDLAIWLAIAEAIMSVTVAFYGESKIYNRGGGGGRGSGGRGG